jgi:hypothetical protein
VTGCPERSHDGGENAFQVTYHICVREPDHTIALCLEPRCPLLIVRSVARVRVAVNLNDQMVRAGAKIGDVPADHNLAGELDGLKLAIAQGRPELSLRLGQRAPQSSGLVTLGGVGPHRANFL